MTMPETLSATGATSSFWEELRVQRWDDHRYYHQSRVNQALHLLSACCFLASYVLAFTEPALAAMVGWLLAMTLRQAGHFFFEPRGYDHVNRATFEHKEEIKVGYNLQRKVILLTIWAAIPVVVWLDPSVMGLLSPADGLGGMVRTVGLLWFWLGVAGLLARTLYLVAARSPRTGFSWMTKILTDPFHDIGLYYKAPAALLRGEWIDPMGHVQEPRGPTPA